MSREIDVGYVQDTVEEEILEVLLLGTQADGSYGPMCTVKELERVLQPNPFEAEDAVARLVAAGLVNKIADTVYASRAARRSDELRLGEGRDRVQNQILDLLLAKRSQDARHEPAPRMEELERDFGDAAFEVEDAVGSLVAAGLADRFSGLVYASRAARRAFELKFLRR